MTKDMRTLPAFTVSHVGLFVFDLDRMVDFYKSTFGFLETDRSLVRETSRIVFLSRDPAEHHQIVLVEGRTAPMDAQLLNQISLRVPNISALREVLAAVQANSDVSDIKPSNHGNAFSIYFRDPEGNRFEVFTDSPFYVEQAIIDPLSLDQSDADLVAETRSRYEARSSFSTAEAWRAGFRRKLDDAAAKERR